MSSFNNMDSVPVKIAENYKPPPRVYQMPQAIAHRIALPAGHYHEAPHYSYDFQLERKVLAKIPEWRRMRQLEREARRERKEKREEERLRAMEAQHKQMLGAVSYPSAEELSNSESDDENGGKQSALGAVVAAREQPSTLHRLVGAAQTSSFHNILQPTILPSSATSAQDTANATSRVSISALNGKALSAVAFNYKDFEEDTSSPFDNIELKTINDWDILAQVLHNTQLTAREQVEEERPDTEQADETTEQLVTKANTHSAANDNVKGKQEQDGDRMAEQVNNLNAGDDAAMNLEVLENTKAALQRVDFDNLSLKAWQNDNIPSNATATSTIQTTQSETTHAISSNCMYHTPDTTYAPYANQATRQQQQHAYTPYEQIYNGMVGQQPQNQHKYTNFNVHAATYSNQNYLYAPICNGGATGTYYSPAHLPTLAYVGHNANNYLLPQDVVNGPLQQHQASASPPTEAAAAPATLDVGELCSKSKSVPDILKELSEEVRNSELRRSRYYSYNSDEGKLAEQEDDDEVTPQQSPVKGAPKTAEPLYYSKLAAPVQCLAKNISSMGFPLERVAKIAQMFGADDKKIVEHLIPLSELMDLGFDETKISEALMKFDNNKEKALEYLIS